MTAVLDREPVIVEIVTVRCDGDGGRFTDAGELVLGREWTRADEDAMIDRCLVHVRPEAWKVLSSLPAHTVDMDDLVGLGHEGLVMASRRYARYCAARGYDPHHQEFQRAFALRRIKGAMLDHLRSLDHVSREQRRRLKQLADGLSPAEAGITHKQADEALARNALRPCSLDAVQTQDDGDMSSDPADTEPAVESQAVASSIQAAALAGFERLDVVQQVVIGLIFVEGMASKRAAEEMRPAFELTPRQVQEIADAACVEIHGEMLRAAG